ncbi:hypothetical protein OSTOST_20512, partial [Ostertagia ostertagi]
PKFQAINAVIQIRFISVAPPILVFLSKSPVCEHYDLSSLEFIMSGAAPAGKDLCEEVHERHPNVKFIQQAYGMSEATMTSHLPDTILGQPFGSIVDPETGKERSGGEIGEVCIRGPTVMLGYFHNNEATEHCIIDGWLHTGDLGYVDDKNYLFVVDRLKELIKVKGFQIRDAAVIAVPHDEKGEVPKAYVVKFLHTNIWKEELSLWKLFQNHQQAKYSGEYYGIGLNRDLSEMIELFITEINFKFQSIAPINVKIRFVVVFL